MHKILCNDIILQERKHKIHDFVEIEGFKYHLTQFYIFLSHRQAQFNFYSVGQSKNCFVLGSRNVTNLPWLNTCYHRNHFTTGRLCYNQHRYIS